jgi:dolichyl-phosphate beta-glucosyltransferase
MLSTVVVATVVVLLASAVYGVLILLSHTPRRPTASELFYTTNTDGQHKLPATLTPTSGSAAPEVELSVVIPCYNEVARLGKMLDECVAHLEQHYRGRYEIVVVDDGSRDGTAEFALEAANELRLAPHVMRVVRLSSNRGKGGAVTHGLLHTRGRLALFADADGATKFADVDKMVPFFDSNKHGDALVAIGSRAHMVSTDAVVKRLFIRNFLMYGLHTLVYVFGIRQIQDTQCGFKMFNRRALSQIFPHMHTERWIFDVEVLLLAEMQGIRMKEFAVNWEEVDGSKVDLAKDSIGMAIDLVVTRMAYLLGIYKLNQCGRQT